MIDFSFTNFRFDTYEDLKPYYDDLLARDVASIDDTKLWIKDYDQLTSHISENVAWRYVNKTCDTTNSEYEKKYMYFIQEINPKLEAVWELINKKIVWLPHRELLEQDSAYYIFFRGVGKSLDMFREENIPLSVKVSEITKDFDDITWAMTIEHEDKILTIQQASRFVESPDRAVRKEVYEKIRERRLKDQEKFDDIMSKAIPLRDQIAKNAGYDSFVEFRRDERGRFDYTQDDVFAFHKGVKEHIVPLIQQLFKEKQNDLWVDAIKPYDLSAPLPSEVQLQPFSTWAELLEKWIEVMRDVYPSFGDNLIAMKEAWRFDLESRPGKAPWWYNYPMMVTQYPFIFMNAAWTHRDLETFVHEAWHAMHSFYMSDIDLWFFRDYPIEVAEVASMSMELFTMNYWSRFYRSPDHLKQAKRKQLFSSLELLSWVSIVDSFQYRMYKHPTHTIVERDAKFTSLIQEYQPRIDYTGYEHIQKKRWQAQPHIFDLPFYYIEYGICGLAAINMRKQYIENPEQAMKNYISMLSLWYTKPIPEIYKAGGLEFDFSPEKMKSLSEFIMTEWAKIQ